MNQIQNPPNEYDFGLDFNYAVWTPGTSLALVNVPWNNDYRDVVRFNNRGHLNQYIDSRALSGITMGNISYIKPNTPVRVDIPINKALGFNYLRASSPAQPVPGNDAPKDYYYFILDAHYLAPNTTELVLQLDVFQTYIYDVQFGSCYIERGHIGIANENQFDHFGRDYLTIPEGLEIGSDYRVLTKRTEDIMGVGTEESDVIIVSAVDLEPPYVSIDTEGKVEPIVRSSPGSMIHGMPSGAGFYYFNTVMQLRAWLANTADKPWITQGILGIYVVPNLTRYGAQPTVTDTSFPTRFDWEGNAQIHNLFTDWRNSSEILNYIPARYRHLKKFFTAPYMMLEMTTWTGTPVALRPELWNDANAQVLERATILPPNQRVQFIPRKYNNSGQAIEQGGLGDDFGDHLDIMTQIAGFPTLPVVNDMAISYLASNVNSIAYQRQSADWSQQRALQGAQAQYDVAQMSAAGAYNNAQRGITNTRGQADVQLNRNYQQMWQNHANSLLGGGVASGASLGAKAGGAGGAVAGAGLGGAIGMANNLASMLINQGAIQGSTDSALAMLQGIADENLLVSNFTRDTNKDYADMAARGDYANAIAGINAKVQDAQAIQPSVSGQFGGDVTNIAYGTMELSLRWKMIDDAAIRVVGDYWLRYGYAVRARVTPPADFKCMTKFTYWKMLETYITSAPMPEGFKQAIRGLFEKGVTVWSDPADLANPNFDFANNSALGGISY